LSTPGDQDHRIAGRRRLDEGFDRGQAFVASGLDDDVAGTPEQGYRSGFIGQASGVVFQFGTREVDTLRLRTHRLAGGF
jgi:hypothetical protein